MNDPSLPSGHPFNFLQPSSFWSASTDVGIADSAWIVGFTNGFVISDDKSNHRLVWCVRGGQGVDPQ